MAGPETERATTVLSAEPQARSPRGRGRHAERPFMRRLLGLLVPDPPRVIPGARALGIALRTGHLLSVGVVCGGAVFHVDAGRVAPFVGAAVATGGALAALEIASTCAWLSTVKGAAVLAKLGLLSMLPLLPDLRVYLLVTTVVVASVTAHMPSRFRHYQLLAAWRGDGPTAGRARGAGPAIRGRVPGLHLATRIKRGRS